MLCFLVEYFAARTMDRCKRERGVVDGDFLWRLEAFVTKNSTSSIDEVELKEWLIARAQRHLIPREIVILSELPYNAARKVDWRALS